MVARRSAADRQQGVDRRLTIAVGHATARGVLRAPMRAMMSASRSGREQPAKRGIADALCPVLGAEGRQSFRAGARRAALWRRLRLAARSDGRVKPGPRPSADVTPKAASALAMTGLPKSLDALASYLHQYGYAAVFGSLLLSSSVCRCPARPC